MLMDRFFLDKSALCCVTGPASFSSDTTTTTTDASSPNGIHAPPSQIPDPSINSDLNLVAPTITSHTSGWASFFSSRSLTVKTLGYGSVLVGLIVSEATAGSLNGVGHSTAYEELATYRLAV